jgi:hypothetical protein
LNKWVEWLLRLCIKNFIRGGVTFTILHDEIELILWFKVVLEVPDKTYIVTIKNM